MNGVKSVFVAMPGLMTPALEAFTGGGGIQCQLINAVKVIAKVASNP
jgi:hypothetical protein